MLKKTVTYTDYNGNERTEDFYFNLTKAEVVDMELSTTGGFADSIQRIVNALDAPRLIKEFKKLVLTAYGEKSADGRRFMKTDEIKESFSQTEAYSIIFMELVQDDSVAAAFIRGITPPDINSEVEVIDVEGLK